MKVYNLLLWINLDLSLSWSNMIFVFCLYVLFDALRTFMILRNGCPNNNINNNNLTTSAISTTTGSKKTIRSRSSTTMNDNNPSTQQHQQQQDHSSQNGTERNGALSQQLLSLQKVNCIDSAVHKKQDNEINTNGSSPSTTERFKPRNYSNVLSPPQQKVKGGSKVENSSLIGVVQNSENNNNPQNQPSLVKRYISLFSSKNVSSTQRDKDELPSARRHHDAVVRTDPELDDHSEVVFLGDVDERGLYKQSPSSEHLLPIDTKLQEMTIVVSKRVTGVTVSEFFTKVFGTTKKKKKQHHASSFFETWLRDRGNSHIVLHDWEYSTQDGDLRGRWCKEHYSQRRLVSYSYRRTTDLHCGLLDASVRLVQMCRLEGQTKLVVRMRTDIRGIPFSECFQTEIRLVVSQIHDDTDELLYQVGVVVDVMKPVVLADTLVAEVIQETTKEQLDLYKSIKRACAMPIDQDVVVETKKHHDDFNLAQFLLNCFKQWDQKRLVAETSNSNDKNLPDIVNKTDQRLRQISSLLEQRAAEKTQNPAGS